MHVIYEALKTTGDKTDGETLVNAAKGMKWESPRGEISIDPDTRDIVQTVYIRRVEKVDGKTQNTEIDKIDNVKDPAKK
jgi:branched-chain amino acid transport system substrate-binding protein